MPGNIFRRLDSINKCIKRCSGFKIWKPGRCGIVEITKTIGIKPIQN
jgi:hypothetical protein